MGNTAPLLIDNDHTKHLAEQVRDIFGYASIAEAVDNSLIEKLATKHPRADPIEKMKQLQKKLKAMRSPEYQDTTDEELSALRLDISGGF